MQTVFSQATVDMRRLSASSISGRVRRINGVALTAAGIAGHVGIGQRVRVEGRRHGVEGEVVAIDDGGCVTILPFGTWLGVSAGDRVRVLEPGDDIHPDMSWLGCVVDGLGRPIASAPSLSEGLVPQPVHAAPPNAFDRRRVGAKLETGLKAVDIFAPLCRGQRMGIFAGSGVGKSTMMSMLTRQVNADVIVIGLVGERGREVQEFIQDDLGEEGMKRSVVVAATGDQSPLLRRQAAWTATAIAEFFRDQGLQVLLMIDSVTRFAMAQREIGLAAGEPPTAKGYPPTVFSQLPALLERSGPGADAAGDISALYTVLVDGDEHNEPIADAVRGILDGHIVLDRAIAERGRYPAIDLQKSISRMLPECHGEAERAIMEAARRSMAHYADKADMIQMGVYRPGSDRTTDTAIQFHGPSERFLAQEKGEIADSATAFAELYGLMIDAGLDVDIPGR